MEAFSGKSWVFMYTLILLVLAGCTVPLKTFSEVDNVVVGEDIETLKSIIQEQGEKIISIEQDLVKYKKMINDQSYMLNNYDDNNQNVVEIRKKLKKIFL